MAERNQQDIRSFIGKCQKRVFVSQRAAPIFDEEKRTVEMALTSDEPIFHGFAYIILDHTPQSINLERFQGGMSLLENHDNDRRLGRLNNPHTDGHVLRATSRFNKRPYSDEIFREVIDDLKEGDTPGTSAMFSIDDIEDKPERDIDGYPVFRATAWTIYEGSIVSIAADISVGVGRSLEAAEETTPQQNSSAARATNQPTIEARNEMGENETIETAELTRAREIEALGGMLGEVELARDFIADGQTVAEFRTAVSAKRKAAQPETPVEDPAEVARRNGGTQLARVVSRVPLKSFRGERAAETAFRFGQFLNAALYGTETARAYCREHGILVKRAHSESDNESGGFLVPTEFENVMIELLLEYGVFRRNANVVPMARLRKERPRRKGGLIAYPIGARGENRRLTESKKNWDIVGLDAKKWGVLAKYEEELSDDAVIANADDFMSEASLAMAQVEDECGFIGDGTSNYHGIVGVITKLLGLHATASYIAGLQQASGNLWSEILLLDILGMVGRLPSFARKTGQVKWYCSNEFWATALCRIALSLGGNALAMIQNEIAPVFLGKPVEVVEVMPHVEANSQVPLLYGNLSQAAMFGDRRGITVKMTDSNDTDFEEDLTAHKATERFDINVHDVGNAHATAAQRKAGPIVALQMASS